MSNNAPIVWLVYPDTPSADRSELDIYRSQTTNLNWWSRWWMLWVFFWNRNNIQTLPALCDSESHRPMQIQELNRLLSGDAAVKYISLNPDVLQEGIQHLAPKSTVYLLFMSPIVTAHDEHLLQDTVYKLKQQKHPSKLLPFLYTIDAWYEAMASQIRASFATELPISSTPKHIILLIHRNHQNWSNFQTSLEKKSLLLQQQLQSVLSGCTIHILLNAPSSLKTMTDLSNDGELWFGFIQETCTHTSRLHPQLQNIPMKSLLSLNNNPAWMRVLLEEIWTHTGTGP